MLSNNAECRNQEMSSIYYVDFNSKAETIWSPFLEQLLFKAGDFMLVPNALTPEIYCHFHELAGFRRYDITDVEEALQNTLYSVVAYNEGEPVGIARVIGDGRITFFIKDVIVHPEFRNRQCGKKLMENILMFIEEEACAGACIGLMSTVGKEPFYEKFGFEQRPNEAHGAGMIKYNE